MIDAKELRIGNYLIDSMLQTKTNICVVETILELEAWVEYQYRDMYTNEFEKNIVPSDYRKLSGIPLTPEILERCGFRKNAVNIFAIELWDITTHLELIEGAKDCFYLAIDQQQPEGGTQNVALKFITYLHQLQNLYFALTGEELIYQP